MHPSLQLESLPPSILAAAGFLRAGGDTTTPSPDANIDPAGIPNPDKIEDMQAGGDTIEAVVGAAWSLEAIASLSKADDAYPELWERVWPWIHFLHTYRESLSGIPDKWKLYTSFVWIFAQCQTHGCRDIVASAPDVRALAATAWDLFLDNPSEHERALFHVSVFMQWVRHQSDARWLEEYVEGASGSIHHLATMIVGLVEQAVCGATPMSVEGVSQFVSVVGFLDDLDGETQTELSWQLNAEFLSQGILKTLTVAIRSLTSVTTVNELPYLFLAVNVLARYTITPPGRTWIIEVLKAGLIRTLILIASNPICTQLPELSEEMEKHVVRVLPPYTVYRSVLLAIKCCLIDAEDIVQTEAFVGSRLFAPLQKVYTLVCERLQLLEMFDATPPDATPPTAYKACDNMKCSKMHMKSELQRCSTCLDLYYCSKQCQKVDWRAGHREDCEKFWALRRLPEEQQCSKHDRAFLRTLIRYDYFANRAKLFAQEIAILKEEPTQLCYVVFDYMNGPVSVNVVRWPRSPSEMINLPRAVLERFHNHGCRAAMSPRILNVHLMVVPNGLLRHWKVFPMRLHGPELTNALWRIVHKMADIPIRDPAFEATVTEEGRPLLDMKLVYIHE